MKKVRKKYKPAKIELNGIYRRTKTANGEKANPADYYMLAQTGTSEYALISLSDNNRYAEAIKCKSFCISKKEMKKIMSDSEFQLVRKKVIVKI